jgi:integrase
VASIKKIRTKGGEDRWVVYWRINGKLQRKWHRTAADAKARKRLVERDEDDGVAIDPRAGAQSLNAYFDGWLTSRLVKNRPLADSTRIGYRRLWDRTMRDSIGQKALGSIARQTVRDWHGTVAEASHDQAAKAYRLLRAVLATAEADELIRLNPCRIKGAGQEHADERPLVETSLVLDLADEVDPLFRCVVLLAGFGGLRTGESLGLRRRHIDLLRGEVTVDQQDQELAGHGRITLPPKSDAGRRVVTIPKVVVDALAEHLSDPRVGTDADAYVFVSPHGSPLRRATLSDAWRAAVHATDSPEGLRLHDLRHHAATLTARRPGITTKELMARIGHSSPVAALRYQHAAQERDRLVADYMDDVIASTERPRRAPVVQLSVSSRSVGVPLEDGSEAV